MDEGLKNKTYYLGSWIFELGRYVLILGIILVLIHFFVATIFVTDGPSMEPNLHSGDYLLINRLSYLIGRQPQRGDIVALRFPGDPEHKKYIKRVIGLPGEIIKIESGNIYVDGQLLRETYIPVTIYTRPDLKQTIKNSEYFLIGDNRPNSNDSRIWGTASRDLLIGKAVFVLYPWKNFGLINKPEY